MRPRPQALAKAVKHLSDHAPNPSLTYERLRDLVGGEELSDAERDQLLQLCRQRLDAFRERQKGMATTLL